MRFVVYDTVSGKIMRVGFCAAGDLALQARAGESVMEGEADDSMHYITPELTIAAMPALGAALDRTTVAAGGVDLATLSALPNPTKVSVRGNGVSQKVSVTDGSIALSFDLAGTYIVRCEAVCRLPQEYTINAT